ncbi:MAG: DNA polymerase III subunit delta [Clostridia bacterium]|nr:DNA polymerase III subunit delta [Clostridia bacterium]
MKHSEFFKNLKNGEISPVYLFCGTEQYVCSSALSQLEDAVVGGELKDVNLTRIYGGYDGNGIVEACQTVSFFAQKRMVEVFDCGFLAKTEGKESEEAALLEYLSAPNPDCVLVFITQEPDKRRKLYKKLEEAAVVEFNTLSDSELSRWVEKILRSFGVEIDRDALSFLLEYTSNAPEDLICELEKLAGYKKSGTVNRADVLAIVTPHNDYNVFKMVDAMMAKDAKAALEILSGMLAQKEEPILILGVISKQYRQLLRCKNLLDKGENSAQILKKTGVRDFQLRKWERICRKTPEKTIAQAVQLCAETDEAIKTRYGAYPTVALHLLIGNICAL